MQIAENRRAEFNEFVAASDHGDVLQCWEWGELKARMGWTPLHLAVERDGRLIATALVLKRAIPRTRRCLFYCPRGPVADLEAGDAFERILAEIEIAAREHGAIALKIDPAISAEHRTAAERMRAAGLSPAVAPGRGFGVTQPTAVMKVDIAPDEDGLLASFHSKWRYNIRLAGRKGVSVHANCSRQDVDPFYDLLTVTAERDGFRIRARSYFRDMWDAIIQPGLGSLFMAYADDAPVAGAIAFALGRRCWYVYGASDNQHRKLMPNHLMQWEIMRWAKSRGCDIYDMRGVSLEVQGESTDQHLAGLNRFKRGFAAQYVEYVGDWDMVFSPLWYAAFNRLLPLAGRIIARGSKGEAD